MADLVYSARRLARSNLGWFLVTRTTLGEAAGNERAININKDVLASWLPARDIDDETPIDIRTRYFSGTDQSPTIINRDARTIRNQGGGKNWRMAGNAIEGAFYDMRVGDLMLMVYDKQSKTLSWMAIRQAGDSSRSVPAEEGVLHSEVLKRLGPDKGSMWIIPSDTAASLITIVKQVFSKAGELLMEQKAMMEAWGTALSDAGFIASQNVGARLVLALETKRFTILSGLSGSGKTLLARLFVRWICSSHDQYAVVPVGSNWTSNDQIMGYADALDSSRYVRTATLSLMLRASANPSEPHFLILDEMNLSHVERYFADFLSAIESPAEPIRFHEDATPRAGVPARLTRLPSNLFVIGTVNVDETTYMFSPKVLDRANVIEFRAAREAMQNFLQNPVRADANLIMSVGTPFAPGFLDRANAEEVKSASTSGVSDILQSELLLIFDILARHDQEFGFRSAHEVVRYISSTRAIEGDLTWDEEALIVRRALDEQILQKMLPKLHGARKRLEPVLIELGAYCAVYRIWEESGNVDLSEANAAIAEAVRTSALPEVQPAEIFMPLSHQKISRLLDRVRKNGFASFAEA